MATKKRKFSEGGVSEGQNPNIDDDTRARALKFVENASEESRNIGAPVTRSASKTSSKVSQTVATPTKPKAESADEYKARMEDLTKKQALEEVHPEDLPISPIGLAKNIAKRGLRTIGADAIKQLENNATKKLTYDKAGDLAAKRAARAQARTDAMRKENAGRYGVTDFGAPGFGALRDKMMKKGGAVKSSASKRADGCAIRGKTRA